MLPFVAFYGGTSGRLVLLARAGADNLREQIERDDRRGFMANGTEGDVVGKLVKVDIDVSHFELVLSEIRGNDPHYAEAILVCDLQNRRCITYNLGDHWSRLDGIVGGSRCDAFLVSKWLNSFQNIGELLGLGVVSTTYKLTPEERTEARDCGFGLLQK